MEELSPLAKLLRMPRPACSIGVDCGWALVIAVSDVSDFNIFAK